LDGTPSLRPELATSDCRAAIRDEITARAVLESGLSDLPETDPWAPGEGL